MLGKLLKYEFRATGRFMWILYAAMAFLSVCANLSIRGMSGAAREIPVLSAVMVLLVVLWVLSLVVGLVGTVVLLVKRFHDNLLTDEGYLMFTLPAGVHQLLLAKILTAAVWLMATMAAIGLCLGIAAFDSDFLHGLLDSLSGLLRTLTAFYAINGVTAALELAALLFLNCAGSILQFYSAMAIGHGFTNHKVLWSVVFYFVQSTALQFLATLCLALPGDSLLSLGDVAADLSGIQLWHLSMLGLNVLALILAALFYALTAWNLKKRLNLS